jgi:hypothetical protein
MDQNVTRRHKSGCTLNALFIETNAGGAEGWSRVYCGNVGDSRCVGFSQGLATTTTAASASAHSSVHPALADVKTRGDAKVTDEASISFKRARVLALSVDHKLSLGRERDRVLSKTRMATEPLPSDVLLGHRSQCSEGDCDSDCDVVAAGYPSAGLKTAAARLVAELALRLGEAVTPRDVRITEHPHAAMISELSPVDKAAQESEAQKYALKHQESFIARRTQGSIIGPEAIFSRYNMSINMTRSIGDKYGPRRVIPVPDVSALSVPPDQFVRLVMCSDGTCCSQDKHTVQYMMYVR